MNHIGSHLNKLGRKKKLFIVLINDVFLALICWIVFGPPMATYIASEFSDGMLQIFYDQWKSFFFPIFLAISYLYIFGFYKSLIKFFDSKDSILLCLSGSLIFGFSWSIIYINQFQIVSTSFLSVAFLQGFLLAAVFYAFLNLSRDVAKYFLYPYNINKDAKNIVIYGAGATGNELFQSILLDPSKRLLAFFDESKNLRDRQINNIPILGSFEQLTKLKEKYHDLEVLLAIPSMKTERRRDIIANLESIKVSLGETENNITVRIRHFAVDCDSTASNCDSSSGEGYHETTVQNIPLQKWVNLTISTFGKSLDISLCRKLHKADVVPNLPKPDVLGNIMITPDGGFSGWTTNFLYTPSPTNPQQESNIYKKGYGGSMLGNIFNKYRLRVQVLSDNEVTGGFEL